MSTTTDVLSLFKYDPVADADSTFNITQALNNNWDKLDAAILLAIAAAGAYNPEESYAVGDYCTYKGKLRKCSTAIPTGEAWTEAHWTTTTVAAEMQELSSQLSNKANGLVGNVQLLGYTKIAGITENGTYLIFGGPSFLTDYPEQLSKDGLNYGLLKVTDGGSYKTYEIIAGNAPATKFGFAFGFLLEGGIAWERAADTTPPQGYDLPLAADITNYATSVYHKNQFNEVSVRVSVSATNAIQNGATIATLPEGFRPAKAIDTDATGYVSGSSWFACRLVIQPSGAVQVYWGIGSSSATFIVGSFAPYLAVD